MKKPSEELASLQSQSESQSGFETTKIVGKKNLLTTNTSWYSEGVGQVQKSPSYLAKLSLYKHSTPNTEVNERLETRAGTINVLTTNLAPKLLTTFLLNEPSINTNQQDSSLTLTNDGVVSEKSNYKGEILKDFHTNLRENGRILRNTDQKTFFISNKKPLVKVGSFVRYGDFLTEGVSTPEPGLVVRMTDTKITIRSAKPVLVSSGGVFHVQHGDFIEENSPLVTLTYSRLKTGDIVQGIPKIEELFEARISGTLHNQLAMIFENYKQKFSSTYAARKSLERIQQIIVENVLNVYQSQGVTIADKHVEIIVRQMTSKVRILESGRSGLLRGELVTLESVENANKSSYGQKAEYEPILVGITKAALDIDKSFISAASFQETTRILSRGAIFQKKDYLKGLKENVILGHIIPAGTAVRTYSRRFQPSLMEQILAKQTLQILTINHEWKLGMVDSNTVSSQYLNPIRHNILQCICLEYLRFI